MGQRDLHERHRLSRRDRRAPQGRRLDDDRVTAAITLMRTHRFVSVTMATAMVTASLVLIGEGQGVKPPPGGVLAEPPGNSGGPIYATFEGWGPLKDGTNALLL